MLQACAGKGDGHAELPGGLGGAERRCAVGCLLSAATGDPDAVEDAGEGGPACHRRQEPAKRACGAPDREEGLCAMRQGAQLIDDKSLTKNDTVNSETLNFTESAQ